MGKFSIFPNFLLNLHKVKVRYKLPSILWTQKKILVLNGIKNFITLSFLQYKDLLVAFFLHYFHERNLKWWMLNINQFKGKKFTSQITEEKNCSERIIKYYWSPFSLTRSFSFHSALFIWMKQEEYKKSKTITRQEPICFS